jgi:LacI family transcriptional regulator
MDNSKYKQLVETLKSSILSGKYGNANPFPSVRSLIRRHGLSNTTVLRALDELVKQGLIFRKQGAGTFVAGRATARKIGLIVPGIAVTDFFKPIMSEINRLAHEADYELHFGEVWSGVREERTAQAMELAERFVAENFAGVIYEPLTGPAGDAGNPVILEMFERNKIPVVLLDCDIVPFPERSRWDVVGVNDIEAGARIAKHLISAGARNIHFLVGKIGPNTYRNRIDGAELALKSAGVRMSGSGNVLHAEPDDLKSLKRYLKRQKTPPDAFICSNDAIAAMFKKTLEAAGLNVPQDVMLTGFADLPVASLMTPTLTTVHQNRELLARTAFRRLMDRIREPDLPPCDIFIPSNIVVRESSSRTKTTTKRKGAKRGN